MKYQFEVDKPIMFCEDCPLSDYPDSEVNTFWICKLTGRYLAEECPIQKPASCQLKTIEDNPKPDKLLPCRCGGERRELWNDYTHNLVAFKCKKCGYKSEYYNSLVELRKGWNKEMEELK